jgi:tetratricopeptide (TPR) repeat protein
MADLDQTLKLDPNNVEALLLRGSLRISERDKAAPADLDAASALSSNGDNMRLRLAGLYARADLFDAAVAQYDLWLAAHSGIGRDAEALSGRCRARAMSGHDLTKALDDCNRALSAAPGTPAMLESRGLVELRLGDNDKAIADFGAALAVQPKLGWALYGRGLAEQRKGLKAEGAADIAAAVAIRARLPDQAKTYGIAGPDGA